MKISRGVLSQSTAKNDYSVGDFIFWATASAAGEYTVIGHPKGKPHVLVFEGGGEVDAELCQPTGRRAPVRAQKYRRRYLEEFPGQLEDSEWDRQTDYIRS
jgi:hypothetical protein